jgi:tetratricopeptide (TPR) repeat protein
MKRHAFTNQFILVCVLAHLSLADIVWVNSLKEALSLASKRRQLVAVFVYDSKCDNCLRCKAFMFAPDEIQRLMSKFVCVLLDVNSAEGESFWKRNIATRTDVLPAIAFLSSDGTVIDFATGYLPEETLKALLEQILSGLTIRDVLKRAQANPKDVDAASQVAIALLERDQLELALPFVERVMKYGSKKKAYIHSLNLHLGIRYAYRGQMELSMKHLSLASSQTDEKGLAEEASFQLAVVNYALGRLEKAREICDRLQRSATRKEIAHLAERLKQAIDEQLKKSTSGR